VGEDHDMTDTTTSSTPTRSSAPAEPGPDDPRRHFAVTYATARSVIDQVRPDHLALPTPCDAFDVHGMLTHLLAVAQRVAAIGRAEDPFSIPSSVEAPDGDWGAAWSEAGHAIQAAWTDDATLERVVVLPWAQLPGGPTLAMYTSELAVHTWDLARAIGATATWDDRALADALAVMEQVLPAAGRVESFEAARAATPEEYADFPPPFAAAVAVPDGAPMIDRLVAHTGRTP
jgi:uncharacterized protein (TIGR03086 family)